MNDDKEELKRISYDMEDKIWQSWEVGYPITLSDEDTNIIIEALNRQIPMKPFIIREIGRCPICKSQVETEIDQYEHCPICGQAIDWNEGDE